MNLLPVGILFIDKDTKEKIFYPVEFKDVKIPREAGKITKQPTPEMVEIEKETDPDRSLDGVLSKYHEERLPKNPFTH